MIERYALPEMTNIWTLESKYNYWLKVELAACKAYNKIGKIPDKDLEQILTKSKFDLKRIETLENEVKHDIIAFLTNVNENVGPSSRFIHVGLTSSDVLDTAFALQLRDATNILFDDITRIIGLLKELAIKHKNTVMIGRSHGIHAEPITMGLKYALWLDIMKRNYKRLSRVSEEMSVGKIAGAVGTYANIDPIIEEITLELLELKQAKVCTQVIQRDTYSDYIQTLAIIASSIELIATEIRSLQRTDVLEAEEWFDANQKGSSAMPHKRNPISSENLTGLARIIRGYSIPAMENIVLWHERDISHSSVERIIFPDATILMNYMLNRLYNTLDKLQIYPDNMKANMNIYGGVIFSQQVMLKLIDKGLSREKAYKVVQIHAHKAWNKPEGNFKNNLLKDQEVLSLLSKEEIDDAFNPSYHLKNLDYIYKKLEII